MKKINLLAQRTKEQCTNPVNYNGRKQQEAESPGSRIIRLNVIKTSDSTDCQIIKVSIYQYYHLEVGTGHLSRNSMEEVCKNGGISVATLYKMK